jgi:N-acetylated-alpha-linked acidic dipeptidase
MDPGFKYGVAQSQIVGSLALRMADAQILPFSFTDAASAYRRFAQEAVAQADASLGAERLDLGPVFQAIDRLAKAGVDYDSAYARTMRKGNAFVTGAAQQLRSINKDLFQSERDLIDQAGLPGREWFKSVMYATGIYTGFEGDPMPGVRQMVNAKNLKSAQGEVQRVAAAVDRMATRAERVSTAMGALAK